MRHDPLQRLSAVVFAAAVVVAGACGRGERNDSVGGVPCQTAPGRLAASTVAWLPESLTLPKGTYPFASTEGDVERIADFVARGSLDDLIGHIEEEWPDGGVTVHVADVESHESEIVFTSDDFQGVVGLRDQYCDDDRLFARIAVRSVDAPAPAPTPPPLSPRRTGP